MIFLAIGLIEMQAFIGGARMVFSLPGYLLISLGGIFLVFSPVSGRINGSAWICFGSVIPLAGYVIGRSLASPVEYLARSDFYMAAGALLVYAVTTIHFSGTRWRLFLVSVLVVCVIAHVITGGIQFKQADNFMLLPGIFRPDYQWRASGFYICPNHLAGLLEMVGLMALGVCCWGRFRIGARILFGYGAAVCLAGLALTGSRGGYVSTIFGLLVFAIISLWIIRRVRPDQFATLCAVFVLGLALLLGVTLLVMFESDLLKTRVGQVYDPTNMRLLLWAAAMKQFHLNPLFGTGSGSYLFLGRALRSPLVQNDPVHVHCDYLELLAEYGILGVGAASIFLWAHLRSGVRGIGDIVRTKLEPAWETSSDEVALNIGAVCAISALLFHSLVDFNFHIPANTLIGAFLFGILARPAKGASAPPHSKNGGAWLRWFSPILGLALLALSAWRIPGEYSSEQARVALRNKQYIESQKHAETGLAYERKNPDLFFYLGEATRGRSNEEPKPVIQNALRETAAEAFQEGLLLFPQDTRLLLKLGQTLDILERFPEANVILTRAISNDPNFGNVYAYYGVHFLAQYRIKEAREYFAKANQLGGNEMAGLGLQQIDTWEKNPIPKTFQEFVPSYKGDPAGSTVLPQR